MKKCSICGSENQDNSLFCNQCGNRFLDICPNCRLPISSDEKYCSNCGTKLSSITFPEKTTQPYSPTDNHINGSLNVNSSSKSKKKSPRVPIYKIGAVIKILFCVLSLILGFSDAFSGWASIIVGIVQILIIVQCWYCIKLGGGRAFGIIAIVLDTISFVTCQIEAYGLVSFLAEHGISSAVNNIAMIGAFVIQLIPSFMMCFETGEQVIDE